jgi:hypothetical protein
VGIDSHAIFVGTRGIRIRILDFFVRPIVIPKNLVCEATDQQIPFPLVPAIFSRKLKGTGASPLSWTPPRSNVARNTDPFPGNPPI